MTSLQSFFEVAATFAIDNPLTAWLLAAILALVLVPQFHAIYYNLTRPKDSPPLIPYYIPYLGNGM